MSEKPLSSDSPPHELASDEPALLAASSQNKGKGTAFWLSFIAIVASIFLSALDLTAVSTALPTITDDLHGDSDFVWVGSAYALSGTAFLPLSGALADIFGRKPVMLGRYSSLHLEVRSQVRRRTRTGSSQLEVSGTPLWS